MTSEEEKQLEKFIRKQSPSLLKGLSGEKKQQLLNLFGQSTTGQAQQVSVQTFSSSPVPPVDVLEGYNAQIPDGANRLFTMVEGEQEHRHRLENTVVAANNKLAARGQLFGFIAVISLSVFAGYCALTGREAVAIVIFGTTLLGMGGVFFASRESQKRDLRTKN